VRTAAYARYSSDMQSAASIDDQLRNVRAYCARQGWDEPAAYSDAAISGARNDRPGYVLLLEHASRFDVIVVDDLSRLSRDSIEVAQAIRRLTFSGVRVIGVSDGTDTGRKGHKAEVGLRGIMSELYLSDLADKTHRGLTGRALSGASAGGLPYGYRVAGTGQREIDEAQAAVVRRIFADYVAGKSPREIAAALNRERVAPQRAGSGWCASAVRPDNKRAIGILANPIYIGRQVWNRSRWVKHPDTGRRLRKERPQAEWITTEHPELTIVDAATWEAARRRSGAAGFTRVKQPGPGRRPRHLLSGILRCSDCGGPIVVIDRYRYGCATHKERGDTACPNTLRIPKEPAERTMLEFVRRELLSDASFKAAQRAVRARLTSRGSDRTEAERALATAQRLHGNIMNALREGIITPSTRAELISAEAAVESARLAVQSAAVQPVQIMPQLREFWRRLVESMDAHSHSEAKRAALQELFGEMVLRQEGGAVYAEAGASQINVVAGAGFERYLTQQPLQIPIPIESRRGKRPIG
jgi:site-specific DNA recombinase